jgi:membrane-associated phospholipid phosphatase
VSRSREAAQLPQPPFPVFAPVVNRGPVHRFDQWVDEGVADRLRGNPVADRAFYAASALGDHGIIWLILAAARGLRSEDAWRATVRAAGAVGVESILVNGPVKWVFKRQRPTPRGVSPHPLRNPRTSSFPSGHATSAFCAAALLSDGDPVMRPVYYGLAAFVAWSRIHVRVHYASDVIGGVFIGFALGKIGKRLVPLPPARESPLATEG